MSLLQVKDVSKFFGGLAAVSGVSFDVNENEILGIIGPNGAGKTTLFNVINGFYKPSKGDIIMNGKSIAGRKPHEICKAGMARTFQIVRPLRRLSVFDNVLASAFLRAKNKADAEKIATEVLKFTDLYEDRETLSKGLPLGKRKRLEIARALATRPKLLLLDESFAGLNPAELDKSIEIIRNIKKSGITVMIIEHHMKVIMSISDRIVVLTYGQKIAEGTPDEIRHNQQVIEAYLGEA
ncbi:ABC transporter ATP-binding protein [Seleniivibrio woodruffii]|uniref:ABC transporter ATP-binding protein n=1 Tax=Seleniivibrio woodruffii TaxID=1078050 RepID=UPI0026F22287|nr:ABC transporter ATP-binding protein [Seleniivibrio woodruffii]